MNIDYKVVATEKINYPEETFDVITACQCFWYFEHEKVMLKYLILSTMQHWWN